MNTTPAATDSPADPVVCMMLFSKIVVPKNFRPSEIANTAMGMDALKTNIRPKLEFLGNIAEDDAYFKIAYKYIRNVSMLDVSDLKESNSLSTAENLKHFILLQS